MHIKVDNISKHYKEVTAVNGLSFEVQQGEVFALLGPNGAGKSSLVRMLVGFTQADEGQITITVNGEQYMSIPASELGYLPEDRGLYLEKSNHLQWPCSNLISGKFLLLQFLFSYHQFHVR